MFKVSAYGHNYRLWVECPLCRAKWWTDVQTFNDHNGVRESSVQSLPSQLSPFTARDAPDAHLSGIAQFFSQYREALPARRRYTFAEDEDDEQGDEITGESEPDLLHSFARTLHNTLNDRNNSTNATNIVDDTLTGVAQPMNTATNHAAANNVSTTPRMMRPSDYRVVDFFPWDQQSSSAASPYVISDLDDDSDDDDDVIGYAY